MKRNLYLALCCGIIVAVVALSPAAVHRKIKSALGDVFSPFTYLLYRAPELMAGRLQSRSSLLAQTEELAIQLEAARYEIMRLRALDRENRELRELLEIGAHSTRELLPARVISRNTSGWWRKVQLDKGSRHGVKPDLAVVSARGLVGRVISVSAHRSDVLLLIDASCRVSAQTRETGAFGIVRGRGVSRRGEPLCRMEFISVGVPVRPGEEVISSGLGGVYPRDIVIGRVKDVHVDTSGLYQNSDIIPAADFGFLDFVFVVPDRARGDEP